MSIGRSVIAPRDFVVFPAVQESFPEVPPVGVDIDGETEGAVRSHWWPRIQLPDPLVF